MVIKVRTLKVLDPSTRFELRARIEAAARGDEIFPITAIEVLNELTARRQQAEPETFKLRLFSIHFGDEAHITCFVGESNNIARIDSDADDITLTLLSYGEEPLATP